MKKVKTFQAHDPNELDQKVNKWITKKSSLSTEIVITSVAQSTIPDQHTRATLITLTLVYYLKSNE